MQQPVTPDVPVGAFLKSSDFRKSLAVCGVLIVLIFAVFGQSVRHGFAGVDDDENIILASRVTEGISIQSVLWAMSHTQMLRWTPLATISRQMDCQLHGLWAGGHHLTSLLLHICASIALFFALRSLTGGFWRSAFVASLFAIHPLHVEPVAWLSARGEVLAGLFFMLTLWAYAAYARQPHSRGRYALVLLSFILGLLSKPVLVTLPLILLLLDYWPLGRLKKQSDLSGLLREKVPLFLLSLLVGLVTIVAERGAENQWNPPLFLRLENAVMACAVYIKKMLWPTGLAAYYSVPVDGWPVWQVILSLLFAVLLLTAIVMVRERKPYLTIGWLWYFVMLTPVLGIIPLGESHAYADRHTYLPMIGPCLAMTWLFSDWAEGSRISRRLLVAFGCVLLAALLLLANSQVAFWKDNITNWKHVAESTYANDYVHNNLGNAYLDAGRLEEASAEFYKALEINPNNTLALVSMGRVLSLQGRSNEAEAICRRALVINPRDANACNNLGNALLDLGRSAEAEEAYREAVKLRPDEASARYNLGNALFIEGKSGEAIVEYRQALRINPSHSKAHHTLADALLKSGRAAEALLEYREGLKINPADAGAWHNLGKLLYQQGSREEGIRDLKKAHRLEPGRMETLNDLAWMLSTAPDDSLRDGRKSQELALQAENASGGADPAILDTLAAAYAETGDYSKALETAGKALALAKQQGNKTIVASLGEEISLYKAGKPCRDPK